jgi:hypothetical protein
MHTVGSRSVRGSGPCYNLPKNIFLLCVPFYLDLVKSALVVACCTHHWWIGQRHFRAVVWQPHNDSHRSSPR